MRRTSILFVLILLLSLLICTGCASSEKEVPIETAEAVQETAVATKMAADEEVSYAEESAEDIIGVFEGLEDNHTAIFSFDGAEKAFYFDTPEVQDVLWDAAIGSSYTLSYKYEETQFYRGLIIYKISE